MQLKRVDPPQIVEAKRVADEAERLRTELSKQLRNDWFKDDDLF